MGAHIDLTDLDALLGGDRALAAELFGLFLDDYDRARPAFVQAIQAGAAPELGRWAHRWRGSLLNLGASECAVLAARVEAIATTGPASDLPGAAQDFLDALDACATQMHALRVEWLAS